MIDTEESVHLFKELKRATRLAKTRGLRKPRVLNITHIDLDGLGCNLTILKCLSDISNSIETKKVNYNTIDSVITNIKVTDYEFVIVTDISPSNKFPIQHLLETTNIPFMLLDHHKSAEEIHDKDLGIFVKITNSATQYVYDIFNTIFNYEELNTEEYKRLMFLIDDYDTWILSDPQSKQLNVIFFEKGWDYVYNKFFNGFTDFDTTEIQVLQDKQEKLEKEYERITTSEQYIYIPQLKLTFVEGYKFTNDICHMILERESKTTNIIIFRNSSSGSVSIRHTLDFHLGEVLKELNLGGGHGKAGGMVCKDVDDLMNKIQIFGDYLIEHNIINED